MKKTLTNIAITALALVTMTGCAVSTEAKITDGQVKTRSVTLETGEVVDCVFWVPVDGSGVASAEGAQMQCFVRIEQLPTV